MWNAWDVREEEYPAEGSLTERFRFLLRYALLAPSGHNTQPWRFVIDETAIELFADPARWLAVADRQRRQMFISCGAALLHLRLALTHFRLAHKVTLFSSAVDERLVARIQHTPAEPLENGSAELLFQAIPARHSSRGPFESHALPADLLDRMEAAAASEGAHLDIIESAEVRLRLASLVAEAVRRRGNDHEYLNELAGWMRSNHSTRADGLPGYSLGMGDLESLLAAPRIRLFGLGKQVAEHDRSLVMDAPALAVLSTRHDTPPAWVAAGQALARVLLTAAAAVVHSGILSQPVEIDSLRSDLGATLPGHPHPQLILRFGFGPPAPPTPRRTIEEVAVVASAAAQT